MPIHINAYTGQQLREIADIAWDDVEIGHFKFGQHILVLCHRKHPIYYKWAKSIEQQCRLAEQRGLVPVDNGFCLIKGHYELDTYNYGRLLTNLPMPEAEGPLQKLNVSKMALLDVNLAGPEKDVPDVLEHETWHLIDYLGDHTGSMQAATPAPKLNENIHDLESQQILREIGWDPLVGRTRDVTAGTLWRSMGHRLAEISAYANHPQEYFVHEQMCRTRGIGPGTIEGYCHTHGLLDAILDMIELFDEDGLPRTQLRQMWQKKIWPHVTEHRQWVRDRIAQWNLTWLLR